MGDVACLIMVLVAMAAIGVVLSLVWIQTHGRKSMGSGGNSHRDLDVDPYTGVPYGAMDDQMDDG